MEHSTKLYAFDLFLLVRILENFMILLEKQNVRIVEKAIMLCLCIIIVYVLPLCVFISLCSDYTIILQILAEFKYNLESENNLWCRTSHDDLELYIVIV